MKSFFPTLTIAFAFIFCLSGCDVEQTQDGELPTVDVDAEPGTMPEYDVDGPDVDVSTQEQDISVPDIDVGMEEKTVTTPTIDVDPADDD